MNEMPYLDFDLWISGADEGYRAKGWDPHGREALVDFEAPWNALEVENLDI